MFKARFRLIHLVMLVGVVAAILWYFTEYGRVRCVAIIDKYRIVESPGKTNLEIQFHFVHPDEMLGKHGDYVIEKIPVECFPSDIAKGDRIAFHYRHLDSAFFNKEDALEKFWRTLMYNEAEADPAIIENLFSQIFQDSKS